MPAKGQRKPRKVLGDPSDPIGLAVMTTAFLEDLKVKGHTARTVSSVEWHLNLFLIWCQERSIRRPAELTRPMLQGYQRHLFYRRTKTDHPLSFRTQRLRLLSVQGFFKWLAKNGYLLSNPAADLDLPRVEKHLPHEALTASEAEAILAQPDLTTPLGLRDRAMLETLYSTGIRRSELAQLTLFNIERKRGTLFIHEGKGKKDRYVPIGTRALAFIDRYLAEVRPQLLVPPDEGALFLTHLGVPFSADCLSQLVRDYIREAGIAKKGACHLFRHTMATLMLENGADIRYIQLILGHASLETTQVYTQVSIGKLKQIHTATHPGATLRHRAGSAAAEVSADELFSSLAAEPGEDDVGDGRG